MTINKISVISLLLLVATLAACQKTFLNQSLNTDPNNPAKVTNATLLASTEGLMAYNTGGPISQFCSLLDQQTVGAANQFAAYAAYSLPASAFDAAWSDVYQYTMGNLMTLKTQADLKGSASYSGISRIMLVYQMVQTTDLWGDVPYTQAFLGKSTVLYPVFDHQASIYNSLLKMLDTAKATLTSTKTGLNTAGTDDFIFGGNTSAWIKVANALKGRLYLHLSKINPDNYRHAIDAINSGGLISNADDFAFAFGQSEINASPSYQLNEQRAGDMDYGGDFANGLDSLSDPRLAIMTEQYNTITRTASLGSYFGKANASVNMLSYAEQNFILAEAYFQTGNTGQAQQAFYKGIKASLNKLESGVPVPSTDINGKRTNPDSVYQSQAQAYLMANGTLYAGTELKQIMTQKYIALYLNPEAYTDWRRTGYPQLTPLRNSQIPRRFAYPLQEYQYNGLNVPVNTTIYSRVFWDK